MSVPNDRRLFLQYLGAGFTGVAAAHALGPLGPLAAATGPMPFLNAPRTLGSFLSFGPIAPTTRDDLTLPPGFSYQLIAAWGDRFTNAGERFGYNADWTGFFPRNTSGTEGLLYVNHEYLSRPATGEVGVYDQTFPHVIGGVPTTEDLAFDMGGSVLHLSRDANGSWQLLRSDLNRRITARSLMIADGPALHGVGNVGGTLGNCSGCHTPWNTVLTCEENFQDYVPEPVTTAGAGTVGGVLDMNGAHFGWVVEIDPHDPASIPVKHTMLGRFRHENVAIRTAAGQRVIAYEGDDRTNGHVYKFVSDAVYVPGSAANKQLLANGRLYAAVFNADGTGEWRELSLATPLRPNTGQPMPPIPQGATTLGDVYTGLGAIVTDAYRASNLIGATPTGRPEDVEVHPLDRSVFIAFTADTTIAGDLFENLYGEIWRLEEDGDGTGTRFRWVRWAVGGPNDESRAGRVWAAPDNLSFDKAGNLWVVTDISTSRLNTDSRYTAFKNNGMFFVPTAGPHAGQAFQFASAPCESELTGPTFTPDESTLFLAIQHPGEINGLRLSSAMEPRGSNWPHVGAFPAPPRPGVVAIQVGG
jgi:secreted PhoX family phosphatase